MAYCNALIKKTGEKCKCKVLKKGDRCRHHPKKKRGSARVNMTTNGPPLHEIIVPCDGSGKNCGWYLHDKNIQFITNPYSKKNYEFPESLKVKISENKEVIFWINIMNPQIYMNGENLSYDEVKSSLSNNSTIQFFYNPFESKITLFKDQKKNNEIGFSFIKTESNFSLIIFSPKFLKHIHLLSVQDRIMKNRKRIEDTVLKRTFSKTPISDAIKDFVDYGSSKKRARVQPRS